MKTIFVLNNFSIYPPDHGGKIRIYNIYKELSKEYKVIYICFGNTNNIVLTNLSENFIEIKVPKSLFQKIIEKIMERLLGFSVDDIIALNFCKFNRKLSKLVENYFSECDIIVASLPYMYPVLKKYRKNKILVYEAHNIEYLLKKAMIGEGVLRNLLIKNVKKNEEELVKSSDLIFAVTAEEICKMEEIYNVSTEKMYVSPNGVDIPSYNILYTNNKLSKSKVIKHYLAIFIGSGHPPNAQAARTIVNDIAPKMKDVYFLICGSVCWSIKNEKIGKNVGLTFEVSEEEKIELYSASDVALNPMLSGSGTNIKMLDYMAAGLPIITTPVGARGLDIENYREAIICDILEFPDKIKEVLGKNELYEKLSHNGRKLVEEKYYWKKIAESMAIRLQEKLDSDISEKP